MIVRVVVCAAGSCLLAVVPALAAPPVPVPEPVEGPPASAQPPLVARHQDGLQAFKRWVLGVSGIRQSGYVESVNVAERNATVLLWKGPADAVQRQILAEGRRRGISVSVRQRRHDYADVTGAIRVIARQARAGTWQGLRVTSISGMSPGYDGIVVAGTPAAPDAPPQRAVASAAGVPVRIDPRTSVAAWATRQSGRAPFSAGGLMASDSAACSSGFAVRWRGAAHVTSARHCTGRFASPGRPRSRYGGHVAWSGDGAAAVFSARGRGRMFAGGLASARRLPVAGFRDLSLGDRVCTGGANSGSHCGLVVTDMLVWMQDQFGGFHTIRADAAGRRPAAAPGDSGGPVYVTSGSGRSHAAGMIQGGPDPRTAPRSQLVRCPTNYPARCGTFVLFSSMRTIVRTLPGSRLVKG